MKKEHIFLLTVVFLALALRLFQLEHMVSFDFDQEYAAIFAQTVLQIYPIKLIGQGLSVQGLFMGPLYFYYLVPFFAATSLNPIGGYIGSIILGGIIVLTYYFVVKRILGQPAGYIVTFLRALLFYKIQADWSMAPSYSSELAILLTWFCFYQYWHGRYNYVLPLGFIFGAYSSFHPILFPFYLTFLLLILMKRKIPQIRSLILSFLLFLIPLSPLLLFEYFHKFIEVKLLFSLRSTNAAEVKTLDTVITYISLLFHYPSTLFFPTFLASELGIISTLLFLFILGTLMKKLGFWRDSFHIFMLGSTIGSFLLYYFLLPTHAPDYYFLGPEVLIFIYIVGAFSLLSRVKYGTAIMGGSLILVILSNLSLLYHLWQNPPPYSLFNKESIIKEIAKRQEDNKMNILYNIDYGQQYGFGYLSRLYNINPTGGNNFPTYMIILPKSKTHERLDYSFGGIGLTITHSK